MNKNKDIKLAISPINWSNDDEPGLGGDIPFEQCIQEMHQAGFQGTEIGNKYPKDAKELLKQLRPHELKVSSAWFSTFFSDEDGYDKTMSEFLKQISFLKALGAEVINVCECGGSIQQQDMPLFSTYKPKFNDSQWQRLIQGLHDMGRIAADFDISLSYHFHLGTGVQNQDEIDYLMQHTSPKLIGLLLDSGHAYAADVDISELIDKYGYRINQVHLKDIRAETLSTAKNSNLCFMDAVKAGLFTVPGDGCIDFQSIFKQVLQHQYQGWWVVEAEQDPKKAPPLEYAQKAFKYIEKIKEATC